MTLVQQFLKSFRQSDDLEPGLFMKVDGTVWLRNPDGSETQLPGGGGGGLSAARFFCSVTPNLPWIGDVVLDVAAPVDPIDLFIGTFRDFVTVDSAVYASGGVCTITGALVERIDTRVDSYDLAADYYVFNAAHSVYLHLTGSATANGGGEFDEAAISHFSLTEAANVGSDLSYSTITGIVSSTAGGTFGIAFALNGHWA